MKEKNPAWIRTYILMSIFPVLVLYNLATMAQVLSYTIILLFILFPDVYAFFALMEVNFELWKYLIKKF